MIDKKSDPAFIHYSSKVKKTVECYLSIDEKVITNKEKISVIMGEVNDIIEELLNLIAEQETALRNKTIGG